MSAHILFICGHFRGLHMAQKTRNCGHLALLYVRAMVHAIFFRCHFVAKTGENVAAPLGTSAHPLRQLRPVSMLRETVWFTVRFTAWFTAWFTVWFTAWTYPRARSFFVMEHSFSSSPRSSPRSASHTPAHQERSSEDRHLAERIRRVRGMIAARDYVSYPALARAVGLNRSTVWKLFETERLTRNTAEHLRRIEDTIAAADLALRDTLHHTEAALDKTAEASTLWDQPFRRKLRSHLGGLRSVLNAAKLPTVEKR